MLPTGTVTFLFTDIEGSTSLWERMPGEMKVSLAKHHALLRQVVERNHGQVFQVIGDSFQTVFSLPSQALKAAVDAQRMLQSTSWGATGPIRVRIGLHSGPAELDKEGDAPYAVNHTLNRVARVMSAGHGGQILLTAAVMELLRGQIPADITLQDMGEYYLRGLLQPEHIFQVNTLDLPDRFPPLKSEQGPRHNLPLRLSSFIGRQKEIAEIRQMLSGGRLLTLFGVGGSGKTRLALAVGEQVLGEFEHGVWLVELAPLTEPTVIPSTVAALFGLPQGIGKSLPDVLVNFFRSKRLLLILDNCEHLVEAAALFAFLLLQNAPEVKILTTSRELLGLEGEQVFPVPPLAMPDPISMPRFSSLGAYEAIQLFSERARAVQPSFSVTEQNAGAVTQICRRLDGIPLAIELAAARVKVLSAEHIATRLDDRFRLLTGGSRSAMPRHQTLLALIDWSYELLSDAERLIFRRLSAFRGGWTFEAAEEVCSSGVQKKLDVLGDLAGLVNKSLVDVKLKGGEVQRYYLLDTIRQYGQEKLVEASEYESIRSFHLAFYLALTERLEPELHGHTQQECLNRLEEEFDNLRAALEWALQTDLEAELRLASALLWFWHVHYHRLEGLDWLVKGLEKLKSPSITKDSPVASATRAKALVAAGVLHSLEKHWAPAKLKLEESIAVYQKNGDSGKEGIAFALNYLGSNECEQDHYDQGIPLLRQGLVLAREVNAPFRLGECLFSLGLHLFKQNPGSQEARQCLKEALAVLQQIGDIDGIATAHLFMGFSAQAACHWEEAKQLFEQSLHFYQQVGNVEAVSNLYGILGDMAQSQKNFATAIDHYQKLIDIQRRIGDAAEVGNGLYYQGWAARFKGDSEMAQVCWRDALENYQKAGHPFVLNTLMSLAELARKEEQIALASEWFNQAHPVCTDEARPYLDLFTLSLKATAARVSGDEPGAKEILKEALRRTWELNDTENGASLLIDYGHLIARQHPENTARLFGAAEKLGANMDPITMVLPERNRWEATLQVIQSALGQPAMESLWAEGCNLAIEQLTAYLT